MYYFEIKNTKTNETATATGKVGNERDLGLGLEVDTFHQHGTLYQCQRIDHHDYTHRAGQFHECRLIEKCTDPDGRTIHRRTQQHADSQIAVKHCI